MWWNATQPEDVKEQQERTAKTAAQYATALKDLGEAIEKLSVDVDIPKLAAQLGIPMPILESKFNWADGDLEEV